MRTYKLREKELNEKCKARTTGKNKREIRNEEIRGTRNKYLNKRSLH